MAEKYYILGASGFMGGGFADYLKQQGFEVLTDKIDITDLAALKTKFAETKPAVVVNFAGVRAYPNVDWCETHKEETVAVNVAGAINIMTAVLEIGAFPIQISSGCVYSGGPEHEFTESDEPNFFGSFYSRMRAVLQTALKELPVLYLRLRMPVSMHPHPRNFIDKIVGYQKVISVPNSVTLIEDMYPAIVKLAELKTTGILNLTNDGYVTHEQVLAAYKEIVDPSHKYELISLDQLYQITTAKRSNCVLSNVKLKSLGISMPVLDEKRLREIMKVYKESKANS